MKNVTIYARKDSPFYWVVYWSTKTLRRKFEATPFRKEDPQGKRKALTWAQPKATEAAIIKGNVKRERWEAWVDQWLSTQYAGRAKTLKRYLGAWAQWRTFLGEEKIYIPEGMDYNAVVKFVAWRQGQTKASSGKHPGRNSALCDVRLMSIVMQEAVRRGFARGNPCFRTGMKKTKAREKPEFTDAQIGEIRAKLPAWVAVDTVEREWMPIAFEIGIHQGCRLRETQLVLERDVDLSRNTIQFHGKGRNGEANVFTTTLHPGLKPLLARLKAECREVACTVPLMGSRDFIQFFDSLDLPGHSFHCTRVTVITKMARAGVPIQQAMRFVGHASETIHAIYQRLKTEDLGACVAAVNV